MTENFRARPYWLDNGFPHGEEPFTGPGPIDSFARAYDPTMPRHIPGALEPRWEVPSSEESKEESKVTNIGKITVLNVARAEAFEPQLGLTELPRSAAL